MKKAILIQSRLSSKRFQGKMLRKLCGMPLVEFVYNRCASSKKADVISIITSNDKSDDELAAYCISRSIPVYRDSLDNVLERYVKAAGFYKALLVCRVCGDSPLVDIEMADLMLDLAEKDGLDYVVADKNKCIAGFDSEVIALSALEKCLRYAKSKDELEHVTLYIKNNSRDFKIRHVVKDLKPADLCDAKLTVDYPDDLVLCGEVLNAIGDRVTFTSDDVIMALRGAKGRVKR